MSPEIVISDGLRKSFGARVAVDGVSFEIRAGECYGFLGPNGAGKTTVMRMIYCFLPPSGGSLRVFGMDVAKHRWLVEPSPARSGSRVTRRTDRGKQ